MKSNCFDLETIYLLRKVLEKNRTFNFCTSNFHRKEIIDSLQLDKMTDDVENLVECLYGYQRLLHIWPKISDNIALRLLLRGIHSAVQIAYMGEESFLEKWEDIIGENYLLGKMMYLSSLSKRNNLIKVKKFYEL